MSVSIAKWKRIGITNSVAKNLLKKGIIRPTPIQKQAIPFALKFHHLFAIAPAGSGKTLAFLLPIMQRIRRSKKCALIISPTRELAKQSLTVARTLDTQKKFRFHFLAGGIPQSDFKKLPGPNSLIFAAPGRLIQLLETRKDFLFQLEILVLDEFDKLLRMGFEQQIQIIDKHIPKETQKLWFSATPPEIYPKINRRKVKTIQIVPASHSSHRIELLYYLKTPKTKNNLLLTELSQTSGQTLIFARNWKKACHLHGFLKLNHFKSVVFHGKLPQKERFHVLEDFMQGRVPLMVATDLAGRGLDTLNVDCIINFSLPQTAKDYIHRLGRTGRLGRNGKCISFASPDDYLPHRNLEKDLDYKIPRHPAYNNRENWLSSARAKHKSLVDKKKRINTIQKEQNSEK